MPSRAFSSRSLRLCNTHFSLHTQRLRRVLATTEWHDMDKVLSYERGLERFNPLDRVITYDDFDNGFNGWMDLTPNFVYADYESSSLRSTSRVGRQQC